VCIGYLIAPLGMAAVNVAIPSLAQDLAASAVKIGWLPTVYILSSVAFMLPAGKLADIYGRKKVYVLGLTLNAATALFSSLVSDIDWLLFWRFMQGVAGAMIFGTGIAIVGSVVPANRRGRALGIVASCVYVGLTLAPAVGGILTETLGWRSVFYFQVPLVIGLVLFVQLALKGEWKQDNASRFDFKGSALFMLFTASFVYGLSKPTELIGLTALLLSVFFLHQSKSSKPLIRVQLFKESRVFSLSLTTSFFMYSSNFAILFLLSLYLQYVQNYTPSEAGTILLVQAFAMAILAPFAGKLADRFEPRLVATAGCFIVAIGFVALNQLSETTSAEFITLALVLNGIGFGLFSTPNNSAIMGSVDKQEVGVASASMNLSRTVGNLFGMSLVNLMIHHFIGNVQISSSMKPELMLTILSALQVSLCFVIAATLFSAFRGRQPEG
jgi:EmrB/QacA subfamily drug resistance transporter